MTLVTLPDENPYEDAWETVDDLLSTTPDAAWPLLLEIVERCDDRDLGMFGAGALATLLVRHPAKFAGRFEHEIRTNDRFLRAFQYTAMSGVPLPIQQQLNAAQRDRGVDPKFIVEYDEELDQV